MTGERFGWRTGAVVAVVAMAVLIGMVALANGSEEKNPDPTTSPKPTTTELTFAVWGSEAEINAYKAVVADYDQSSKDTNVTVVSWPDAASMLTAIKSGAAKPDLYLLPRTDLAETIKSKRNVPLLDLLNAREIPIGDDFGREAVAAFSVDDNLQCLPYTRSPMVIYYNTALVDFEAMEADDLPVPNPEHTGWNMAEFRAAAEFASRPRLKTRGVHIDPTLRGLAPFVYSGGGKMFDDDGDPKRLALGDDGSAGALRQTLEVLRDPRLTLSTEQLSQRSALDWFKRGRLGMIAGFRSLTPELRAVEGLDFDVMPMPNLGSAHTVADLNGICISPGRAGRVDASANFLTYLVSDEAVARVSQTGYVQPTKLTVALSSDFLQPGQLPVHASVFNEAVRSIVFPPLLAAGDELGELINPDIKALLTTPVFDPDLNQMLKAIDEKSRSVLDPDYEPDDSPSSGAPSSGAPSTGVPSVSPSGSTDDDRKRD